MPSGFHLVLANEGQKQDLGGDRGELIYYANFLPQGPGFNSGFVSLLTATTSAGLLFPEIKVLAK